jgi:hypothetical protein
MAMALGSLRPAPLSFARVGRGEQHMDAIPKERQLKNTEITPAGADLPPVLRERQLVLVLGEGRLADNVVPLPQVVGGDLVAVRFREPRQKLANARISCCNIRHNRI